MSVAFLQFALCLFAETYFIKESPRKIVRKPGSLRFIKYFAKDIIHCDFVKMGMSMSQ